MSANLCKLFESRSTEPVRVIELANNQSRSTEPVRAIELANNQSRSRSRTKGRSQPGCGTMQWQRQPASFSETACEV
ncbi:hypothetical protein [Microcoleus sp.]|uniref:hypothetical protein n=1 Tax=Microcoleus sp. TaxID=44472 RepID=UPI00403EDA80